MGMFNNIFGKLLMHGQNLREPEDIAFEKQVREDGIPHASKRIAELVNEQIHSRALAEQFVLEELDAARRGKDFALTFARNSGYGASQYVGAMQKTQWEGDESQLEYVQLFLRNFMFRIQDRDLMMKLGIAVVDEIMKTWKLGRYNVDGNSTTTKSDTTDNKQV